MIKEMKAPKLLKRDKARLEGILLLAEKGIEFLKQDRVQIDDEFQEHCEANNYEFNVNGKMI